MIFFSVAPPASDIRSCLLLGPCILCAPLLRSTYAKRLTKVTGQLTVTIVYYHTEFQNTKQGEHNLPVKKSKTFPKCDASKEHAVSYSMAATDPAI